MSLGKALVIAVPLIAGCSSGQGGAVDAGNSSGDSTERVLIETTVADPPAGVFLLGGDTARGAGIDGAGNIFVTGMGAGMADAQDSFAMESTAFLTKLDSDGNQPWTVSWRSGTDARSIPAVSVGLAADTAGRSYVAWGCRELRDGGGSSLAEGCVSAYSTDGAMLWTRRWAFPDRHTDIVDVALGPEGALFAIGSKMAPAAAGEDAFAGYDTDVWLSRVDADGNEVWTTEWRTERTDEPCGLAMSRTGEVFAVANSWWAADPSAVVNNLVVLHFSSSGELLGERQWEWHEYPQKGLAAAVDPTGEFLYLGGVAYSTPTIGDQDAFVMKLSQGLDVVWNLRFGTKSLGDGASAVAVGRDGRVWAAGGLRSTWDPITKSGRQNMFVSALLPEGHIEETKEWTGGASQSHGVSTILQASNGDLYLAGATEGGLLGSPAAEGSSDAFVLVVSGDR